MQDVKALLNKFGIVPDPLKDQFFMLDEAVNRRMVEYAEVNGNDTVLEIGAGPGNLTRFIAEKAKRVIAFEIDKRFAPILDTLPENAEVHYENAWNYIQLHGKFRKKKEYNKIVSNLPYSFTEPFLHNLTFLIYDKVILLIPKKFLKKIDGWAVFGSFFSAEVLTEVPKDKFYPVPRTNSVIIELLKLPDPIEDKNPGRFLRQYLYQHEQQLVKNSLMEGIIHYARLTIGKTITKNTARRLVAESGIDSELLAKHPNNPEIYDQAEDKLGKLNDQLTNV